MNDYVAFRVDLNPCEEDTSDLLASYLADIGFESFVPDKDGLTAYIRSADFCPAAVEEAVNDFPIPVEMKFSHQLIEGVDWNSEWEKNYFQPIVVDDLCVIHSTFHKDVPAAKYDIVIDPKMAFGTGHHATTSMMLRHLLKSTLSGKTLIDMGTGTGILAILAKMLGAQEAWGIEIDPAAFVNAEENVRLNNVDVYLKEGDSERLKEMPKADLFLANINRNVILADLERYSASLVDGGELILSGFYESDILLIQEAASLYSLELKEKLTMADPKVTEDDPARSHGDWASLRFIKVG